MIDKNGFRSNVGIVICNHQQQLFWGQRARQKQAWQFPQGGMLSSETPKDTMLRELYEEVGLTPEDIEILAESSDWLKYTLPESLVWRKRKSERTVCIGQKQKWFLVRLRQDKQSFHFNRHTKPEFSDYRWVDYWYPVEHVVDFKRDVYRRVLEEFAPLVLSS